MSDPIACSAGCGRQLPSFDLILSGGELVCEPCHEARTRAAERRDSIDDAWRAVESVPGWRVTRLAGAGEQWMASASRDDGELPVRASSTSPTRALRLLSRVLADRDPVGVT